MIENYDDVDNPKRNFSNIVTIRYNLFIATHDEIMHR